LDALGIHTVEQLAKYKYFLLARAIKTLAETETEGGRPAGSVMNIDKAVDKDWEAKTLTEICDAPTEALEGIAKDACELLEALGCKTIGDLADLKYCTSILSCTQTCPFKLMCELTFLLFPTRRPLGRSLGGCFQI
jgi:hypothetical protein